MSHTHTNPTSQLFPLQSMSPGTSKENKDKPKKPTKKSPRSVWSVPTEKLWSRGCSTPTLPLYNPPPTTPIKGTSISKLKEMNGWKWREKQNFQAKRRWTLSWRTGRHWLAVRRRLEYQPNADKTNEAGYTPTIVSMFLFTSKKLHLVGRFFFSNYFGYPPVMVAHR